MGLKLGREDMTRAELDRTIEGKKETLRQYREAAEAEIKKREAEIAELEAQTPDVKD